MHCLVWPHKDKILRTIEDIDSGISTKFPCKIHDSEAFEFVSNFMMHRPCGFLNPQSPCMRKKHCLKYFSLKII